MICVLQKEEKTEEMQHQFVRPLDIAHQIAEAMQTRNVSMGELQKLTNVHKSQISRFCKGHFSRVSKNLRRVCEVLQIDLKNATVDADLGAAVLAAWDGTPKRKEALLKILRTLARWNG